MDHCPYLVVSTDCDYSPKIFKPPKINEYFGGYLSGLLTWKTLHVLSSEAVRMVLPSLKESNDQFSLVPFFIQIEITHIKILP